MSHDEPDFHCVDCDWQGDEDEAQLCPYCGRYSCPECPGELQDYKEYLLSLDKGMDKE